MALSPVAALTAPDGNVKEVQVQNQEKGPEKQNDTKNSAVSEGREQKKQDDKNTGGNNTDDGKGNGGNKPDTQVPNPNQVNNQPTKVTSTPVVNNTQSLPKIGASRSDNMLTLLGVVMLAGGAFAYKRSRTTVNK